MYVRRIVEQVVEITPKLLGQNVHQMILDRLKKQFEGKCIADGYVRKDSIVLLKFSLGKLSNSANIQYLAKFECDTLFPAEGMQLSCQAALITKMGIRSRLANSQESPLDILIPRDHYIDDPLFQKLEVGDIFEARVIAHKFQFADREIFVFAEIVPTVAPPPAPALDEEGADVGIFEAPPPLDANIKSVSIGGNDGQDDGGDGASDTKAVTFSFDELQPKKKRRIGKRATVASEEV
jgi:DNA-directed RNA polymerase subunit E'/Rpb7